MKKELLFSGIGGQGVITLGETLCDAAIKAGYNVTFVPFYGQEKRGGRTMCNIVVSDGTESPIISEADIMLIFDERSLRDYQSLMSEGGTMILNSDLVELEPETACKDIRRIPFSTMAQEVGNSKTANVIALGYIAKFLPMIPYDLIAAEVERSFAAKPKLIPLNLKALKTGYDYTDR
jgi:2-oxoglutarate ferredoxin oxidoreductase subunit gamma